MIFWPRRSRPCSRRGPFYTLVSHLLTCAQYEYDGGDFLVYLIVYFTFFFCFSPRCPCFFHQPPFALSRYYCFCIINSPPCPSWASSGRLPCCCHCCSCTYNSGSIMLLLMLWSIYVNIYFLCTRYEAFYFTPSDNVRHKLQRRSLLRKQ